MLRTLDGAFDGFVMLRKLYLQHNRLTSFCLELWRNWNISVTLTYPTIVWRLSMNTVLTVWKASRNSIWHGISWKLFHLKSFEISATWASFTCTAIAWEHFHQVFLTVWKASRSSTWHGISWKLFHLKSFEISATWANFTCTAIAWEHFHKMSFTISVVCGCLTSATMAWR